MEVLEKYLIDELEKLKRENAQLKQEMQDLKDERKMSMGSMYTFNLFSWGINENNYREHENDLKEHGLPTKLFKNGDCSISSVNYNYVLQTDYQTVYLNVKINSDGQTEVEQIYPKKNVFRTRQEAEAHLIYEVEKEIKKYKPAEEKPVEVPDPESVE